MYVEDKLLQIGLSIEKVWVQLLEGVKVADFWDRLHGFVV